MTVALYHQSIVRKNITWRYCIATIAEIEKLVMFFIQKRLHEYSARITQTKRDAGYHQAISRMFHSSSPNYCFHFFMTEQTFNFSIFGAYICEY